MFTEWGTKNQFWLFQNLGSLPKAIKLIQQQLPACVDWKLYAVRRLLAKSILTSGAAMQKKLWQS
jgi:hypothetical protein